MKLVLASSSPRRIELLRNAGFDFDVVPSGVEEGLSRPEEPPQDYARRLARDKALHVAERSPSGTLVLGADTIVTIDGLILGKPTGLPDAARMLRILSGHSHTVITAICLAKPHGTIAALEHETTTVTFCELNEDEIRSYVASREPLDKAGAYAIQGQASKFVTGISGCYFNVVGLPLPRLYGIFKRLGEAVGSQGAEQRPGK